MPTNSTLSLKQPIVILQETQGRSLFVYALCVSTRHSIYNSMSKYVKKYVMFVLALSDFS